MDVFIADLQELTAVEYSSGAAASKSSQITADHAENNLSTHCPPDRDLTAREEGEGKNQRAKGRVGGVGAGVGAEGWGCTGLLFCTDTTWDVPSANILIMMTKEASC